MNSNIFFLSLIHEFFITDDARASKTIHNRDKNIEKWPGFTRPNHLLVSKYRYPQFRQLFAKLI
ncbi:hypothetical protein C7E23_11585 [Elizabethkingia anophelis]|nr:hypothetical protein C7E23_11585 [Elizabethkingia anophelis]